MKRILITLMAVCAALGLEAQTLRFMPQWTPQAQFAGYYMAFEKGFFKEAGLDVEICHLSKESSSNSLYHLEQGDVDFCTGQLIQGIVERSLGNDIVDVLQTSQNSGLMCVSHTPISSFKDLDGKKVGRWKSGFGELADMFCDDFDIDIKWVYYTFGINLFVAGAIDATLCFSFNEYLQLLMAKGHIDKNNVVRFSDLGYNFPEDAVFVREDFYNGHKDLVDKFKYAARKGWDYARSNPEEALDVVMRYAAENGIITNRLHQKMMLEEILSLQVNHQTGKADCRPVSEEIFNLLNDNLLQSGYMPEYVKYNDFIR